MPNTKSAQKRLRQSEERRLKNRAVKSSLKTQLRKVREAVGSGELEKASTEFRVASKKLDQAGHKRVIHKNKASRIKSRLSRLIKTAKQKSAPQS